MSKIPDVGLFEPHSEYLYLRRRLIALLWFYSVYSPRPDIIYVYSYLMLHRFSDSKMFCKLNAEPTRLLLYAGSPCQVIVLEDHQCCPPGVWRCLRTSTSTRLLLSLCGTVGLRHRTCGIIAWSWKYSPFVI